jgi:dipeptidyl aminopeptidase/acylaminoacyl peptidase
MQEALEKAGVDIELIRVPGGGHGPSFGGAGDMPSYIDATGKWFDRYLLGKN